MGRKPSGRGQKAFGHSREVIREARRRDCDVIEGGGSHFKVRKPNGEVMTCYHGRLSKGVAKVVTAFLLGIIVLALLAFMFC